MAIVVRFKRSQAAHWEGGLGISHEDEPASIDVIVDQQGKPIPDTEMWDFQPIAQAGCIVVDVTQWNG